MDELIERKVADSKRVIREALTCYGARNLAIAFTGGKDSTLLVHLVREVCAEAGEPVPPCFVIDEGDMFPEVREFIDRVARDWGLEVRYLHNDDVSRAAGGELGAVVRVAELNERNRSEVERLGYDEDEFPYEPESFVGNHLMKTATLNAFLYESGVAGFFEGIRWDEQGARCEETYLSPRAETPYNPEHVRVCPILHFTRGTCGKRRWRSGSPTAASTPRGTAPSAHG